MPSGGDTGAGVRPLRLLVTVTFNPNQLRAHLLPLIALERVESITLVSDVAPPALRKVRGVVPPRPLARLLGRAGAKLLVCLWLAAVERPDWVVAFNFVPHGFNARVVGAVTRTRSLYHMIGGEQEWRDGGWSSDNRVLGRLHAPSPRLERLLLRLIGGCTMIATMGERGRAALLARGIDPARVHVVRPSVDTARFQAGEEPAGEEYDVVAVGQLIPRKRVADLLAAVEILRRSRPGLRVAVVGSGPLEADLHRLAGELGMAANVDFLGFREDVGELYRRSRVFVLTSGSEGLPISMLEAMASGVPPVVTEVDEIGAFVRPGETGYLFPVGDVARLAEHVDLLLADPRLRAEIGAAAARQVAELASVEAVAAAYDRLLGRPGETPVPAEAVADD